MMGFSKIHRITILLFAVTTMMLWANVGMTQTKWEKYGKNPVLRPEHGKWDADNVLYCAVLFNGTEYEMWYSGGGYFLEIGYAHSVNGIDWPRYSVNPVLPRGPSGSWDLYGVYDPTVLFDGITYRMWYTGRDGDGLHRIGYATSLDGIEWEKYDKDDDGVSDPVLEPGDGTWDGMGVSSPTVLFNGTEYEMWYAGVSFNDHRMRIGHATSPDGITWTKNINPVLVLGASGEWDEHDVGGPTVLFDSDCDEYRMWYGGSDGSTWRIGYATSIDGIEWSKCLIKNPVLDLGGSGEWDDELVADPAVLLMSTKYRMWYNGYSGSNYAIGYAVSRRCPCCFTVISSDSEALEGLYRFRDNVLTKNDTGRKLTGIYYQYSAEVVDIIGKKPMLVVRCSAVLKDIMPGIFSLLGDKRGKDLIMTPLRVARIKSLFRDIGKEGGKELAQTLSMLSASLDKYKGMRVSQIWRAIDMKAAPGLKKDNLSTTWGSIKRSVQGVRP